MTHQRSSQPFVNPDFRNLGTIMRTMLIAESAKFGHVLATQGNFLDALISMGQTSPQFEAILLSTILVLFLINPWLHEQPYLSFSLIAIGLTTCVATAVNAGFFSAQTGLSWSELFSTAVLAGGIAGGVLFYFQWRQLSLSPALAEAKLSALQARIRPHFLFNSLNTVLGLIRPDPKRAESVLENLADLFRALLADPRALVPLERELELARAYAEVESLRLGNRLSVVWHCEQAPVLAQVPQLILQPLIENAVLHGIEPSPVGGEVHVNIFAKGDRLVMVVRNPLLKTPPTAETSRNGNHMALANIRERLDLHYDAEARMTHFSAGGEFVVQIEIPLSVTNISRKH
jgi:two-component system sensor histidine kinase AlgZ